MSIIEKVFKYGNAEIAVIKRGDEIWFRGKQVAKALNYVLPSKAVRQHVELENRITLKALSKGGPKWTPLRNSQNNTIFINESGLYTLILSSKMGASIRFKKWVTKDVLHP